MSFSEVAKAFSLPSMLTELADGLGLRGVLLSIRPKIGSSASALLG
jgi:hypothetical protein